MWPQLNRPIVVAPMAGGPSTAELVAAVCTAGGTGFLAAGYKTAVAMEREVVATRELTDRPFGVNLFVAHEPSQRRDEAAVRAYAERIGADYSRVNWSDDDGWYDKLAVLTQVDPVPMVSFTFGCPTDDDIAALHSVGTTCLVTVTDLDEARAAAAAGADLLVVQGFDAGGHRATHEVSKEPNHRDALALLDELREVGLPMVATGGVGGPGDVRRMLDAGAVAVQCGTAFLRCPEAGTSATYRELLSTGRETVVTRAFSGRPARGLRNAFIDAYSAEAPSVFPQVDQLTKPLRAEATRRGRTDGISGWAGLGWLQAQEIPAAEVVAHLSQG